MLLTQRPSRSDVLTTALYWLVATPFILTDYVGRHGWWRAGAGLAWTLVLDTATVYVLVFGLLPGVMTGQRRGRALAFLPGFLMSSAVLYQGGYALAFGTAGHWTILALLTSALSHAVSYGLLAVLLTGKRYFEVQQHVLHLQKAQAENELRNLRTQFDPHFLFNNLNVLRGLIQQDPAAASEYLNRLAALYRFLIRHQHEDVVSLSEELQFADEYLYLLRQRFGSAYEFRRELPSTAEMAALFIVPGTLQLLLENAIKHNAGNEDAPLFIYLEIKATGLTVRHDRRPKLTPVDSVGTGLTNLRERYRLLFRQEIQVAANVATFTVTVPLLRSTSPPKAIRHDYSDSGR